MTDQNDDELLGDVPTRELVTAFHRRFDKPIRTVPTIDVPDSELSYLIELLAEETTEFLAAIDARDLEGVADALGDIVYAAYGAAVQLGIDLDKVIQAVHLANMTKSAAESEGSPRAQHKPVRGPDYVSPAVAEALGLGSVESDEPPGP